MQGKTTTTVVLIFLAALASADSWPQFRGNSTQTGVATSKLSGELVKTWTYEANEQVSATAAIDNDTVYIATKGSGLLALELKTGKLKWRSSTKSSINSSPLVHENRVYVGDSEGKLRAIDASNGKELWVHKTDQEIISSPNFCDGKVVFGSYDGSVCCLDAKGGLLWKVDTGSPVHASPAIDGKRVIFAGCDGTLRFVNIDTGEQEQSVLLDPKIAASPAVRGGRVYVVTLTGTHLCVDIGKKEVAWKYHNPTEDESCYASPAVDGNGVVFASRSGPVRYVDLDKWSVKWQFASSGDSSPVISGDYVYIGSDEGVLSAVSLKDGRKVWEFKAGDSFKASPAVAQGRLVISTASGTVYCFKSK